MPRKLLPSGKRNYKNEYAKDHASPKQKKNRGKRNAARKKVGLKRGDPREVDHRKPLSKGGTNSRSNTRVVSRKTNRSKGKKRSVKKR